MEIWKIIENFPDYAVSDQGRVKSFKFGKEIILTSEKNNKGYLCVNLYKNKKPHPKKIHKLVLEAFKPNEDLNKTECNHKDGNKENNYVENLEWCTRSDNIKHAFKLGLQNNKGENNPMFGRHRSKESKRKQSYIMKEKFINGELNILKGENHPMFGKKHSEEWKRKQSEKMKGENGPNSILTEKNVIQIRKLSNEGNLTQKEIAKKFGVTQATISLIKNGKNWKHI